MRPVTEFFRGTTRGEAVWVLAGKGPSFARRPPSLPLRVMGLNHVCLHLPCDLVHFADLDAYADCAAALAAQPAAVVMPFYPHVRNKPGRASLEELSRPGEAPGLAALHRAGRLFAYNSSLDKRKRAGLPHHRVRYFSAVVALDILAGNGVKSVITVGIDGGAAYAPEFDGKTLLSNGRASFDAQFGEMRKIAERHRMVVKPIVEAPR